MEIFKELPLAKQTYMEVLFQNCTEEVKYYMRAMEVGEDETLIEAGEKCSNIYIILSGRATGIEWPMHNQPYSFKDYGPGDFFGEIEYFSDLFNYRISVVTATPCRVLVIPVVYYMEWLRMDVDALFMRTKENMRQQRRFVTARDIRIRFGGCTSSLERTSGNGIRSTALIYISFWTLSTRKRKCQKMRQYRKCLYSLENFLIL